MIYLLLGIIVILILLSIVIFREDLSAPSFLLNAAFFVAVFCGCMYANVWDFDDYRTVLVVTIGLVSFFIFSAVTYMLDKQGHKSVPRELIPIDVQSYKLWIYLLFQIALYLSTFFMMLRNTGGGLTINGIANIVGSYYEMNRTGTTVYSSSFVNIGQIVNFSFVYYMLYIAIVNIFCKKKNKLLIYVNIIVGIVGSLLTGTKTAFYMFVVGAFIMTIVLRSKTNGWKKNISIKSIFKIIIILLFALAAFVGINSMQGRTMTDVAILDTIATYLGSPIKNLELFIKENHRNSEVFGGQTFASTYSDLYDLTGNSIYKITSLYKYRWLNGHGLGNVYTIFMPLYYDFGVFGVFVVMGFIGIFTQKIYDKMKYRKKNPQVDFYIIFYAYLAFAVMFSFFSNKFFECIFSKAGIYFVIGIYIFDVFITRLDLKRLRIRKGNYR